MSDGRVLSEEQKVDEWFQKSVFYVKANGWIPAAMGLRAHGIMQTLIATIRDRDKTIAEFRDKYNRDWETWVSEREQSRKQNTIMRDALEYAAQYSTVGPKSDEAMGMYAWEIGDMAREALAKVGELPREQVDESQQAPK